MQKTFLRSRSGGANRTLPSTRPWPLATACSARSRPRSPSAMNAVMSLDGRSLPVACAARCRSTTPSPSRTPRRVSDPTRYESNCINTPPVVCFSVRATCQVTHTATLRNDREHLVAVPIRVADIDPAPTTEMVDLAVPTMLGAGAEVDGRCVSEPLQDRVEGRVVDQEGVMPGRDGVPIVEVEGEIGVDFDGHERSGRLAHRQVEQRAEEGR